MQQAKDQDPIRRFAEQLKGAGVMDDPAIEAVWAETKPKVDEQIDQAWNAADPDPETLGRHVYFEADDG